MAVTIQELIGKRESIKAKKKALYDMETSIGTITVKAPTASIVASSFEITERVEANKYIILECTVEPNLKAAELQQAYECLEPLDIVSALFPVGEIGRISDEIFNLAGYGTKITSALHKEIRN